MKHIRKIKGEKYETENKSIRFPVPLIEKIEKNIEGKATNFSSFVIQACEYALDNMEDDNKEKSNNNK